jgi:hypothetical protein
MDKFVSQIIGLRRQIGRGYPNQYEQSRANLRF